MNMKGVLCAAITTLTLAACSDPNAERKQALTAELQQVGQEYTVLSQAVAGRKTTVTTIERQLMNLESERSDYKRTVTAYMMNHKLAVAALALGLGGASVALDADNEFSDEAEGLGTVAVAIAAVYALANAEEVAEVADRLVQADSYVKDLDRQIAQTTSSRNTEVERLSGEEFRLHGLETKQESIRVELVALQ